MAERDQGNGGEPIAVRAYRVADDELWPTEGSPVELQWSRDADSIVLMVMSGIVELERFEVDVAMAAYFAGQLASVAGVRFGNA